jgi:hypothetical protein
MTVRRYAGGLALLGLIVAITLLGSASLGRAGSVPNANNFVFSVQPQFVTAGKRGFAKGTFTAASGSGTGSATQVVMTIDLPTGFAPAAGTSSGCSGPTQPDNIYSCAIGTVRAGEAVTRFVAFVAPSAPNLYTGFSGCVTFDNGSGGAGGGGGNQTCDTNKKFGQTTVVASGDTRHAGSCDDGSASTASVSADNLQNSALSGVIASSSANVPCPWVVVGVASNPSVSNALTQISFTGFPKTDVAAKWTIDFYTLPAPFSQLALLLDKDYTEGGSFVSDPPLANCAGPNNTLGPGQVECQSLVKVKQGAQAILWLKGTGADPGAGLG